jgi:CubicO group peptidase (beta-lactamase class C family)
VVRRARVARSPTSSIRADLETDPRAVGANPDGVTALWRAVERLYASGIHPAVQLCVRRHGRVLVDRAIGHASGNGPDDPAEARKVLATPDTPFCSLSASKAVTAMVVHLLDQENLIRLDDPICEYIPEFGAHGKHWITIRHVLAHRAGIPNLPPQVMRLEHLDELDEVMDILCEAEPVSRAGRQLAYHAVTGGFVLGELVHRVTGRSIRQVLDDAIRPSASAGSPPRVRRDVGGRDELRDRSPVLPPFRISSARARLAHEAVAMSNRFLTGLVPAANVVATADELSRSPPARRRHARRRARLRPADYPPGHLEQSYPRFDFTLGLPPGTAWAHAGGAVAEPLRLGHARGLRPRIHQRRLLGRPGRTSPRSHDERQTPSSIPSFYCLSRFGDRPRPQGAQAPPVSTATCVAWRGGRRRPRLVCNHDMAARDAGATALLGSPATPRAAKAADFGLVDAFDSTVVWVALLLFCVALGFVLALSFAVMSARLERARGARASRRRLLSGPVQTDGTWVRLVEDERGRRVIEVLTDAGWTPSTRSLSQFTIDVPVSPRPRG